MNGSATTANKDESRNISPGVHSPTRVCSACKVRRSVMQYRGAGEKCLKCIRRTPK